MRIKSVKGIKNRILDSEKYIEKEESYDQSWDEFFCNDNEIHIELGIGRGDFLTQIAEENPNINYIGIEKYTVVIARAAGKIKDTAINNVALLIDDIDNLQKIVKEDSIERIYMNFLDPWPKKKHEKRRSTSEKFLCKYKKVLKENGEIHFKTDNNDFFVYSLDNLIKSGFDIRFVTTDLYSSEHISGNIQSEYEKKFVSQGCRINKIVAGRK